MNRPPLSSSTYEPKPSPLPGYESVSGSSSTSPLSRFRLVPLPRRSGRFGRLLRMVDRIIGAKETTWVLAAFLLGASFMLIPSTPKQTKTTIHTKHGSVTIVTPVTTNPH